MLVGLVLCRLFSASARSTACYIALRFLPFLSDLRDSSSSRRSIRSVVRVAEIPKRNERRFRDRGESRDIFLPDTDRKTRFHPPRCLSDAVDASIAPVGNRIRAQTVRGSGIASFDPPMGCDGGSRTSFESLSREMGRRWKNCQRAFLIPSCSRYALLLSSVSASLPPSSSFSSSSSPSGTSYLLHRFLVQGVAQTQYVFAMRARYYDVRCIHVIVRVRDA